MASNGNEERNRVRIWTVRVEPAVFHIQSDSKHVAYVQGRDTIAKRPVPVQGSTVSRSHPSKWSRDLEPEKDRDATEPSAESGEKWNHVSHRTWTIIDNR